MKSSELNFKDYSREGYRRRFVLPYENNIKEHYSLGYEFVLDGDGDIIKRAANSKSFAFLMGKPEEKEASEVKSLDDIEPKKTLSIWLEEIARGLYHRVMNYLTDPVWRFRIGGKILRIRFKRDLKKFVFISYYEPKDWLSKVDLSNFPT